MTITNEYIRLNAKLHEDKPSYGTSGKNWVQAVSFLKNNFQFGEILDYGCGKQTLSQALPNFNIKGYDPAIPEVSSRPKPAELVICSDVLEHIEPDLLDSVILDLHKLSKKMTFVVLSTRPAKKTLSDGRNAHLIVMPPKWWVKKFESNFDILSIHFKDDLSEFILLMIPRHNKILTLYSKYRWTFSIKNSASKFFKACYVK